MSKAEFEIPPGYVMDAKGNFIKEGNMKDEQREEDALVNTLFPRAMALHDEIAMFKYDAMKAVEDVVRKLVTDYGIKRFEKIKGNVAFTTFNGKYRVERAIQEKIEYNATIEVARQTFDQYVEVLEQQSGSDAKAFIQAAFSMKDNQFNVAKLVDLCNKNIDHPLYKKATTALREALFVGSSKAYLRFYIRNEQDDSWTAMPLQFSSITAKAPDAVGEEAA